MFLGSIRSTVQPVKLVTEYHYCIEATTGAQNIGLQMNVDKQLNLLKFGTGSSNFLNAIFIITVK